MLSRRFTNSPTSPTPTNRNDAGSGAVETFVTVRRVSAVLVMKSCQRDDSRLMIGHSRRGFRTGDKQRMLVKPGAFIRSNQIAFVNGEPPSPRM